MFLARCLYLCQMFQGLLQMKAFQSNDRTLKQVLRFQRATATWPSLHSIDGHFRLRKLHPHLSHFVLQLSSNQRCHHSTELLTLPALALPALEQLAMQVVLVQRLPYARQLCKLARELALRFQQ